MLGAPETLETYDILGAPEMSGAPETLQTYEIPGTPEMLGAREMLGAPDMLSPRWCS
jgi:hypothetical protein